MGRLHQALRRRQSLATAQNKLKKEVLPRICGITKKSKRYLETSQDRGQQDPIFEDAQIKQHPDI